MVDHPLQQSVGAVWSVEVVSGAPIIEDTAIAPISISPVATMLVGDGESDVSNPIVYGPVLLVGDADWLSIQIQDQPTPEEIKQFNQGQSVGVRYRDVRILRRPSYSFDHFGGIAVGGFEAGADGALRWAAWYITPYRPTDGEED